MISTESLVKTYSAYTAEELLEIIQNPENYSDEAVKAANIVIESKGGVDSIKQISLLQQQKTAETERITKLVTSHLKKGIAPEKIKEQVNSPILSYTEIEEIITAINKKEKALIKDKSLNPRTIIGSVIGGIIATLVSGILLGQLFLYTNRVLVIMLALVAVFNYLIVYLCTKQTYRNTIVLIATICSTALAFLVAQLVLRMYGVEIVT